MSLGERPSIGDVTRDPRLGWVFFPMPDWTQLAEPELIDLITRLREFPEIVKS